MPKFDAVVVSDLHLGARNSRGNDFLRFLHTVETNRLVLAGDLFDHPRLQGLQERDVAIVEALKRYALAAHVDWVIGNHDPPAEWFASLFGVTAYDEVVLDIQGSCYLVYHGHGWDPSLDLPPVLVEAADAVYAACQWLDPSHRLARLVKRKSKHFCQVVDILQRRAINEARERELAGVILGHSHVASETRVDGIHFLNCGCWTEKPPTFVGVKQGGVQLYEWDVVSRRAVPRSSDGTSEPSLTPVSPAPRRTATVTIG